MSAHFPLCNETGCNCDYKCENVHFFVCLDLLGCKRFLRNYMALDTHEKHCKHHTVINWHAIHRITFLHLPSNFNIPVCPVYL